LSLITLILTFAVSQTVWAIHVTTTDGTTYKHAEITRVEPDALVLTLPDGIARVPYEKLPTTLRSRYFNPAKVATYRSEQARQAAAAKSAAEQRQRDQLLARQQAEEQHRRDEALRAETERQQQASMTATQPDQSDFSKSSEHTEPKSTDDDTVAAVCIIGGILVVALICWISAGISSSCPSCKQWWSAQRIDVQELDRWVGSVTVTRFDTVYKTNDFYERWKPEKTVTVEKREAVPVTKVRCLNTMKCKHCGHTWKTETIEHLT